jgi:putative two-component system response regulator
MKTLPAAAEGPLTTARILVVDDQPANVRLLEATLRAGGYTEMRSTSDPCAAAGLFAEYDPDIVVLDLHMPELDGFALLGILQGMTEPDAYLPVLVLTADDRPEAKERALAAGAMDFVNKPFKAAEVLLRIRNLLHTRMLHLELRDRNRHLDLLVRQRTVELEDARLDILLRLAAAAEYRDDVTGRHTRRVGRCVGLLAGELGLADAETIGLAAMLHDVGKIGVADSILQKPGSLTPCEFEVMKTHTTIGQRLLAGSASRMMQMAEQIALTHHEHWDGGGYHGMRGKSIPLAGRLTCVADVFDALTHDRPYRPALSIDSTLQYLRDGRGAQFDPTVLDAFLRLVDRLSADELLRDHDGAGEYLLAAS